ncbi:MAG: ketose-bisphosphate aldolase [Erysipelotrichia bacterium]|nr:ketose-bisphosphate aldolase [Erysipelotrichia bacterium]
MLITMEKMLKIARNNNFAVGAFNICDSLLFKAVMTAAEKADSPVIVQLIPDELRFVSDEFIYYVKEYIHHSKLPVVLHLDHGESFADCVHAIDCGFTSVMIDASRKSYEDNIALTEKTVVYAHRRNVSVEAELGTIGVLDSSFEKGTENIIYTRPEDVTDFIEKTDCDSLAIAIGTSHGIYPKDCVPKLRIDLLKEINKVAVKPLVLHGGSANKDEEIAEACKNGINKVNIASDYQKAFFDKLTDTLNEFHPYWTPEVYSEAIKSAKETVLHKMKLFDSIGKASLYRI